MGMVAPIEMGMLVLGTVTQAVVDVVVIRVTTRIAIVLRVMIVEVVVDVVGMEVAIVRVVEGITRMITASCGSLRNEKEDMVV
jgi:hypothetical protein